MLTSVPIPVQQGVLKILHQHHSSSVVLSGFSFTLGGCINHGGKLVTSAGPYFLKWNDAKKYPDMFAAEAEGLTLLQNAGAIHVPAVIGTGVEESFQFLVLSYIDSKPKTKNFWRNLGQQLASLHRVTNDRAGLPHDNYIGSLPQFNLQHTSWIEFFISQRLEAQLSLMENSDSVLTHQFESLFKKLPSLLAEEKHSLLHGDLWSGNLIANQNGDPCFIDPAVYFGNREIEISYTQLFGGFDIEFYASYHEAFHLQPGFEQRALIYNLYPLLVHVNLFGGGYLEQVKSILRKFA